MNERRFSHLPSPRGQPCLMTMALRALRRSSFEEASSCPAHGNFAAAATRYAAHLAKGLLGSALFPLTISPIFLLEVVAILICVCVCVYILTYPCIFVSLSLSVSTPLRHTSSPHFYTFPLPLPLPYFSISVALSSLLLPCPFPLSSLVSVFY